MDIVLGNYKGLKANIPYIAYTEEDVNSQIATLLSGNPVREQKTGPLAMGDTAVIDYEGFKDGVAFEGGKAEDYPLTIGSHSFIDTFEEQLIGKNTEDCMRSGIVYGTAGMLDGVIDRIRELLPQGETPTIVATGSNAPVIVRYCRNKVLYDKYLLMEGLYAIYQKNAK